MNIGEAVKERIIELCRERDISINKLCSISGVTQSTVNMGFSGFAAGTVCVSRLFPLQSALG